MKREEEERKIVQLRAMRKRWHAENRGDKRGPNLANSPALLATGHHKQFSGRLMRA